MITTYQLVNFFYHSLLILPEYLRKKPEEISKSVCVLGCCPAVWQQFLMHSSINSIPICKTYFSCQIICESSQFYFSFLLEMMDVTWSLQHKPETGRLSLRNQTKPLHSLSCAEFDVVRLIMPSMSNSTLNSGYGGDYTTAKVRYDKRLCTMVLVHWKCSWYSSRIVPSTTGEVSAINAIYWRVCYKKGLHNRYGLTILHCVSKNDIDVACYNFKAHQPILVILQVGCKIGESLSPPKFSSEFELGPFPKGIYEHRNCGCLILSWWCNSPNSLRSPPSTASSVSYTHLTLPTILRV